MCKFTTFDLNFNLFQNKYVKLHQNMSNLTFLILTPNVAKVEL